MTTNNDEGMWTFDALPTDRLQGMYGFTPTNEWCAMVMHSAVRFNTGGSGSFVSANGLVITNHHVAETTLQDYRTEEQDLVASGFAAATTEDELPAKQLEVNVLQKIVDVTDRVRQALVGIDKPEEIAKAKRAIIAEIEAESKSKTGLRSNVVTLYQGGLYHLYLYKRYTDVRLVFAPEKAVAAFGGDTDNFTFPRFCLDFTFFRVYENGKPLDTPDNLRWSDKNTIEGGLLFVAGHPGHTDRTSTLARVVYLRDHGLPYMLRHLYRLEIMLQQFAGQSGRNREIALDDLFHVENTRKAVEGQLSALADPSLMREFADREESLRTLVVATPALVSCTDAWGKIAGAETHVLQIRDLYNLLENGLAFNSTFFQIARGIVRLVEEDQKPNAERLEGYQEAGRESLLHQLLAPSPIYPEFEQWKLANSLRFFGETFGFDHSSVRVVLGDMSPSARAHDLVSQTSLASLEFWQALIDGGMTAISGSADPFIKLALLVDEDARKVHKDMRENVIMVREMAYAKIADARFVLYGTTAYPDATFTLRLAYGRSLGYTCNGTVVPLSTKLAGLFGNSEKHGNQGYWQLPERWVNAQNALCDAGRDVDYNFVTTHDIHGGNSGSPVFDEKLHFVGIVFDGNGPQIASTFLYQDTQARTIAVSAAGITAALRCVYRAERLLAELGV